MDEVTPTSLTRFENDRSLGARDDLLATEAPLEIRIEGQTLAIVMRTPGADRELAAGFLLSEGIVASAKDLFDITTCVPAGGSGSAVDVGLANPRAFDRDKFGRHVFTSASCGVCGKTSLHEMLTPPRALEDAVTIPAAVLHSLPPKLLRVQSNFQRTGGVHACALFDARGELLDLREDVGRHNALDKLIGHALLEKRTPLAGHIALLSGRASFEMVQKAYAGGIAVIAAIGAPSSLAVDFARAAGQTLIGFLREKTMNIYTGAQRVTEPAAEEIQSLSS